MLRNFVIIKMHDIGSYIGEWKNANTLSVQYT